MNQNYSHNPLLSVIIPTRNRPDCLQYSVESAISSFYQINVEIIIVSNGDSKAGDLFYLKNSHLSRVKVIRSDKRLSMGENWKYGFKNCTGKWVIFHGDDDLFLPFAKAHFIDILSENKYNGIKFKYHMHDWIKTYENKLKPSVNYIISEINNTELYRPKIIPIDKGKNYWNLNPRLYPSAAAASIVKKSWLTKIDNKGALFNSISPDWYTAFIFALTENYFVSLDLPLISIGNHPNSSITQIKDQKLFFQESTNLNVIGSQELFDKIGYYFPTTWRAASDALIQAKKYVDNSYQINFENLVKKSYRTTPKYVFKVYLLQRKNFPEYKYKHYYWLFSNIVRALLVFLTSKLPK